MMDNSKCGRKSLGLVVLVISQILCLAQADDAKPNGWDSVLDRIKSDLNSNGGAEKPSSVLRGTERERELKHKVCVVSARARITWMHSPHSPYLYLYA